MGEVDPTGRSEKRPGAPAFTSPFKDDDEARAAGAAYGIAGFAGVFSWLNRSNTRRGMDVVSPMTAAGTVHVMAWCALVAVVGCAGLLIAPGLGARWFGIAIVVMLPVAWWWSKRHGGPVSR